MMRRVADRMADYGWRVLLGAVSIALVGGVIQVFIWEPSAGPSSDVCPRPPCGPEGLPRLSDAATVLPILGYLLVIVLGVPSLLSGTWDLVHGRGTDGGRRLLAFVGPVLVLVGTEIVPHIANLGLCAAAAELCSYSPEWGTDISDRWHPLDHAVLGAVPMTAIYWLARRR
ncbi:MAG: hypothetical protein ACRDGE_11620 [Candidatus Limnocylindria bacterium]